MPQEERDGDDERKARNAYDLARMRLERLQQNPGKLAPVPQRKEPPKPKPPPEFIRNVVGSSAAAGSAEFHIYRNNRRKEMNRMDYMEREYQKQKLDEEYKQKMEDRKKTDAERAEKNRKKRLKRKQRERELRKLKKMKKNEESSESEEESDEEPTAAENAAPTENSENVSVS